MRYALVRLAVFVLLSSFGLVLAGCEAPPVEAMPADDLQRDEADPSPQPSQPTNAGDRVLAEAETEADGERAGDTGSSCGSDNCGADGQGCGGGCGGGCGCGR